MRSSRLTRYGMLAVALALAGCADASMLGVGIGGGSAGTDRSTLVGSWRYTRYVVYEGQEMLSETTWRFESSGSALRTLATSNLTYGTGDMIVRSGSWTLAGSNVQITFTDVSPSETVSFRLTRESADRIWLGDIPFVRIAP